jgi:hypothetical protein
MIAVLHDVRAIAPPTDRREDLPDLVAPCGSRSGQDDGRSADATAYTMPMMASTGTRSERPRAK